MKIALLLVVIGSCMVKVWAEVTSEPETSCTCKGQSKIPPEGQHDVNTQGGTGKLGAESGQYPQQPFMYMPMMYAMPHWPMHHGQYPSHLKPLRGEKGEPGERGPGCGACVAQQEEPQAHGVKDGETKMPGEELNIKLKSQAIKGDIGMEKYKELTRDLKGEKGDRGETGPIGLQGPPGPPGPAGQTYPNLLGRRLEELRQSRLENVQQDEFVDSNEDTEKTRVAFTVAMSKSVGPSEDAVVLKFEEVTTNIGNGYNTETGEFMAPVPGVYYFTYHILGQHSKPMEVSLKHENKLVNSVHSRQTGGYTGVSNSAVLKLNKGDKITLVLSPAIYFVYGESGHHTTFTGYLLYPE